MENYGLTRVAAASLDLKVADCDYNTEKILEAVNKAREEGTEYLVLPELCITGYTCADLFMQHLLLERAVEALLHIAGKTEDSRMIILVGLPLQIKGRIYNCAAVLQKGEILGLVPKTNIPGYNEFYEPRWFAGAEELEADSVVLGGRRIPVGRDLLFVSEKDPNISFGVEICEDLWVPSPPSSLLSQAGAVLLFNPSASNELVGKADYRLSLVENQSARCVAAYVYAAAGVGESTTDVVFGGHSIIAENGRLLSQSQRFETETGLIFADIDMERLLFSRMLMGTFRGGRGKGNYRCIEYTQTCPAAENKEGLPWKQLYRQVDRFPFVPANPLRRDERCHEILSIQTSGLMKRLRHTGMEKVVIGISGGLDSTLAFLVAVRAFQRLGLPVSNVVAVTMPGFGTTDRTYDNAVNLIKNLGADLRVVNIREACLKHFEDIGHDPAVHDVTYENVQARERTQILMDLANKIGGLVVGTGDLSELALGWCTYNGDHISMYGVNSGVPKTLVKYIIQWFADHEAEKEIREILYDVIDTPISPELLPPSKEGRIAQKTEDILGPYEVHDFYLYQLMRTGASPSKSLYLATLAFSGVYGRDKLSAWIKVFYRRFFSQQFKRSCLPDGPKVGTISLSPRGDWRMPSDASAALWLKDLENL